jgi:hypothetical protein
VVLDRVIGGSLDFDEASRVGQHLLSIVDAKTSQDRTAKKQPSKDSSLRLGYRGARKGCAQIYSRENWLVPAIARRVPQSGTVKVIGLAYVIPSPTTLFIKVAEMSHSISRCIINFG